MGRVINIQDGFLNQLRRDNVAVTVYLVNGVQIKGYIRSFDNFTVIIESDSRQMMVYKHALSTIAPITPSAIDTSSSESSRTSQPPADPTAR